MDDEIDPKLAEWMERLGQGEPGANAARDTLFAAVCSTLGASPAELAAATQWLPRQPSELPSSPSALRRQPPGTDDEDDPVPPCCHRETLRRPESGAAMVIVPRMP